MANKQAWKNGVNTQFRGNSAVKAQEKAAKTQRENGRLRRICLEEVTDEDLRDFIRAQKVKAKDGDAKAFELIRDTMGEKPVDKIEQTVNEIAFRVEGVSQEEADEIFG